MRFRTGSGTLTSPETVGGLFSEFVRSKLSKLGSRRQGTSSPGGRIAGQQGPSDRGTLPVESKTPLLSK